MSGERNLFGDDTGLYIAEVSSSLIWDVRTQRHRWSPTTMHAHNETEKETPISTHKAALYQHTAPSPVAGFPLDIETARPLSANWAFGA